MGDPEARKLDWRDYLALFVAMVQTIALPMVLLVVVLLVAIFVLKLG